MCRMQKIKTNRFFSFQNGLKLKEDVPALLGTPSN